MKKKLPVISPVVVIIAAVAVFVLSATTVSAGRYQQLIDDPGFVVPDAGESAVLLALSFGGLAFLRRMMGR
ncbi:MAG: VPDSG-CTERM sorting domain-containing protein [bacterium]